MMQLYLGPMFSTVLASYQEVSVVEASLTNLTSQSRWDFYRLAVGMLLPARYAMSPGKCLRYGLDRSISDFWSRLFPEYPEEKRKKQKGSLKYNTCISDNE